MVSAGSYILSVLALAAVGLSIGFTAYRLRQRVIPEWEGAPARLVESVVAVALLVWIGEALGTLQLFYTWAFVGASLLVAGAVAWCVRPSSRDQSPGPAGPGAISGLALVITVGAIALVVAHWGLTTKDALDRGIFNFDSLWYHMPFAVDMVQSHSVTGLHYPETVFTNWLYPQNSELLHAIGVLLTGRDTLSLFLNFGFLAISFLAAWCIGRPYGRGHLTVVAAAVVLECHTLVVREPGAAKNDLVAAALLLAAAAILVNALRGSRQDPRAVNYWPLAVAGLATGLAVGTKSTALAMAAALTLAVIVLAPAGRRWAIVGWWFVPAILGGGYWYLRNLIVAGNPLPQISSIGPISLPHPERIQEGRPDFSIVHYLTDTAVWREYFGPGLDQAFGTLWPLVVGGAILGGLLALFRARDSVLRWMGLVALFGLLAYLFTPLSAAGAEGAPVGFGINIRYAIPALLLGLVLLSAQPWLRGKNEETSQTGSIWPRWSWEHWTLLIGLLLILVATNRADAVLRDPARIFGLALAFLVVVVPAGLLYARSRGAGRGVVVTGFATLALLLAAIGYPIQRNYLQDRFAAGSEIPGMDLDPAYQWARDVEDARIGLAGTTAGFLQYGLYGPDLSNEVIYLAQKGPHAAFNPIPTCKAFRAAVNAADLDYLVTAPFLNFIHTDDPIPSPESTWLRADPAAAPIQRSGEVTIWRIRDRLDPSSCGPANTPLQRVPNTPESQSQ